MAEGGDVSHPNGEGETRGGATQPFRENMEVVTRFFHRPVSGIVSLFPALIKIFSMGKTPDSGI